MRISVIIFALLLVPSGALALQDRPLLLVHGFFTGATGTGQCLVDAGQSKISSWYDLQNNLVQDGLYSQSVEIIGNLTCPKNPAVYSFTYYDTCYAKQNAIEAYTDRFESALKQVQKCSGDVDIAAHSLGGLIVRNYLQNRNGTGVHKIIFIATPHDGASIFPSIFLMPTCIVDFLPWCPAEINEIKSDSKFIRGLRQGKMPNILTYTLKSTWEVFFPPGSTDILPTNESVSVNCYHDDLYRPSYCPEGYKAIKGFLKG